MANSLGESSTTLDAECTKAGQPPPIFSCARNSDVMAENLLTQQAKCDNDLDHVTLPSSRDSNIDHVTRRSSRDSGIMRGVVQNMVVNMECVLGDIQGIMGDIKTLVTQIDAVTDKIDRQCGVKVGNTAGLKVARSGRSLPVRRSREIEGAPCSLWVRKPDRLSLAIDLSTKIDTKEAERNPEQSVAIPSTQHVNVEGTRTSLINTQPGCSETATVQKGAVIQMPLIEKTNTACDGRIKKPKPHHTVQKPRCLRRDSDSSNSVSSSGFVPNSSELSNILTSSPDILSNTKDIRVKENYEKSFAVSVNQESVNRPNLKRLSLIPRPKQRDKKRKDIRKSWPNNTDILSSNMVKRNTFSYLSNKGVSPTYARIEGEGVTPPDKRVLNITSLQPETDISAHYNVKTKAALEIPFQSYTVSQAGDSNRSVNKMNQVYEEISPTVTTKPIFSYVFNDFFQPETPTEQPSSFLVDEHTQCKPYTQHIDAPLFISELSYDSCTSLSTSPVRSRKLSRRGSFVKVQRCSLCSSPRLRRFSFDRQMSASSSPRAARSRPDNLPISPCRHGNKANNTCVHLYQSIESDLDSDASECLDLRCITPDMDWSYLNLLGDDGYEVAVTPLAAFRQTGRMQVLTQKQKQILQKSPDGMRKLNKNQSELARAVSPGPVRTLESTRTPTCYAPHHVELENIYDSPVVKHIFCSEVGSDHNYCGFYEAVVDSILEHFANLVTSEESLDEFGETAHDTYVSFDNDFEEDDWYYLDFIDSEKANNTGLTLVEDKGALETTYQELCSNDSDSGSYKLPSIFIPEMTDIKEQPEEEVDYISTLIEQCENNLLGIPDLDLDQPKSLLDQSHATSDSSIPRYADVNFPYQSGFPGEDCCILKSESSVFPPNFELWPNPSFGSLCGFSAGTSVTSEDRDSRVTSYTSSDDASRDDLESLTSAMSLSTPDLIACSPDTDVFATSSDADDLFRSHDQESCSASYGSDSSLRMTAHRNSMMLLRKDFFDSLYTSSTSTAKKTHSDAEFTPTSQRSFYDIAQTRLQETQFFNGAKNIPTSLTTIIDDRHADERPADDFSDSGSFSEHPGNSSSYNRNLNTWTAYAMVHVADDASVTSDTASDILNDNSNMTSSCVEVRGVDNNSQVVEAAVGAQQL